MDFVENKKYLFQCFNNTNKPHRYGILSLLKHNNLLQYVDYSLLRPKDFFPPTNYHESFIRHIFSLEMCEKIYDDYCFILNKGIPKYIESEGEFIIDKSNKMPDNSKYHKNNPYKNAYINIVTESQYEFENLVHITEKTVQPFYYSQIPIFVSAPLTIKNLKKYYDFDFFDDFINHSYDNETNPEKRMLMIVDEIKRLSENPEKIKNFYVSNKHRLLENQKKVELLSKSKHKISEVIKKVLI